MRSARSLGRIWIGLGGDQDVDKTRIEKGDVLGTSYFIPHRLYQLRRTSNTFAYASMSTSKHKCGYQRIRSCPIDIGHHAPAGCARSVWLIASDSISLIPFSATGPGVGTPMLTNPPLMFEGNCMLNALHEVPPFSHHDYTSNSTGWTRPYLLFQQKMQ